MWRHRLDRQEEMGRPEPSSSRSRRFDVFASSQKHEEEIAQQQEELKSIANRLDSMKRFCENKMADQGKKIAGLQANPGLKDVSQITEIIQTELPLYTKMTQAKNACKALIDYIEEGKTDRDLITATDQIIEFLKAHSQPGMEHANHIRSLADDIERNKQLFKQHSQSKEFRAIDNKIGALDAETLHRICERIRKMRLKKSGRRDPETVADANRLYKAFNVISKQCFYMNSNENQPQYDPDAAQTAYNRLRTLYSDLRSITAKGWLEQAGFDFAQNEPPQSHRAESS